MLTWRWTCERSGSQRPDTGLRCSRCVSSRPLEPLCHGTSHREARFPCRCPSRAESGVAVFEQAAASQGRWKLMYGKMNSSSQKM